MFSKKKILCLILVKIFIFNVLYLTVSSMTLRVEQDPYQIYGENLDDIMSKRGMHMENTNFGLPVLPNGMSFSGILNKVGNKFLGYRK